MMFITKFNAMIRNKILWGAIAIIVVMAFVLWDTQTGGDRADGDADSAGMLDGRPVKAEEFRHAYFNTYLSTCLAMGRRLNITEETDALLRRMTWKRLATMRTARAMGLTVTDDEVVAAIREQPFFMADGRFSRDRYRAFIMSFLADLGVSERQFEEFMRQEIAMQKMKYMLAQSVWVPPHDVARIFHQLYDEFTVQYTALLRDELDHMVSVTEEDAWALFATDPDRFMIPEQVSVKYVSFPIEEFVDESSISDELIWKYYDDYINTLIETGADDWDSVPLLDDVKDEVRRLAAWQEAEKLAGEQAFAFEMMLTPDRAGQAPAFETAAASMGLTVSTSEFFSVYDRIKNLEAGPDFNEAAFRLRPTPEERFSYPVQGENEFYILGYHERRDSRIPDFNEVRDDVMEAARERAITEKLDELAADIHEAMKHDIADGIAFEDSAGSFGLEVFDMGPFTVTSMLDAYEDTEESYMLMTHAVRSNAGDLTDVIRFSGGLLIGYVAAREPASRTTYDAIRNDLLEYVKQTREETAFNAWQSHLLESAGLEDPSARREMLSYEWEDEL